MDYPATGKAAKFMAFIEKELQPFIQKKYKTNTVTTIIGQSVGGLFTTEVLLKKPTLFNNYIIVSPSSSWENETLLATDQSCRKNKRVAKYKCILQWAVKVKKWKAMQNSWLKFYTHPEKLMGIKTLCRCQIKIT